MIIRVAPPIPRWLGAVLASATLVAAVTAVIVLLEPGVPPLGPGVLYLLAVVPIALVYGRPANVELRKLSHGILPAALIQDGLRAG
jgi:hypothetical protein